VSVNISNLSKLKRNESFLLKEKKKRINSVLFVQLFEFIKKKQSVPVLKLFQIPELPGGKLFNYFRSENCWLSFFAKTWNCWNLVISKNLKRIGEFHERMNNELVVLWPVI
jgi:hypothetical protein